MFRASAHRFQGCSQSPCMTNTFSCSGVPHGTDKPWGQLELADARCPSNAEPYWSPGTAMLPPRLLTRQDRDDLARCDGMLPSKCCYVRSETSRCDVFSQRRQPKFHSLLGPSEAIVKKLFLKHPDNLS